MSSNQVIIIWLAASLLVVASQVEVQCFENRSLLEPQGAQKMQFLDTPCRHNNSEQGSCLIINECERRGGMNKGLCGNGAGVCCSIKITCGGTASQNETIFVNPQYPESSSGSDTCQLIIEKTTNVCQFRLDFDEFELAQPDKNGLCTNDSFIIMAADGERFPVLCGHNAKQHIYVDMGLRSLNQLFLMIVSNDDRTSRKWKIKIKMIPCDSIDMAPSGCLQYYRSPSAVIRSFNYGARVEGLARYMSNLRYTACIRKESNFCAIKWVPEQPNSFSFGSSASEFKSSWGGMCKDDFIGIDQGSMDGTDPGEDRFCGGRLLYTDIIISTSKPFQLRVSSNGDQTQNNRDSQIGFSLRYRQLSCFPR